VQFEYLVVPQNLGVQNTFLLVFPSSFHPDHAVDPCLQFLLTANGRNEFGIGMAVIRALRDHGLLNEEAFQWPKEKADV
jgi:hypothetical protein